MKKYLLVIGSLPLIGFAYNPSLQEPAAPYEPIVIEGDIFIERNLLGDLDGSPDLFEFTSDVAFSITAQLKQKNSDEPVLFGLLLVRQNDTDGGVTEVARQNVKPETWFVESYPSLGMTFREGPVLERDLTPGTYRIEVSTPDNYGTYMLVLGDETVRSGPISKFIDVFITQFHFGVFFLAAFISPYVTIPIVILLTIFVWFKRKWDTVEV